MLLGLAFAGSRGVLAEGTHVAGVDVGGMTEREAVDELARSVRQGREAAREVRGRRREVLVRREPARSGARLVARRSARARRAGDGFGPIRGYRRLHTRFFGAEVLPRLAVSDAALEYALDRVAGRVDRAPRSAALVRRGLDIRTVRERAGVQLEREAAARTIVRALGSLERTSAAVALPVAVAAPDVTAAELAPVARRARVAISGPVTLRGANRSWRLPRWRIAQLITLPSDGAARMTISGPRADAYFRALGERVGKAPVDATFAVSGETVHILPSKSGTELDVPHTARALLQAATSRTDRVAELTVVRAQPDRTTAEALAMGIDTRMAGYKTYNSGTWDRDHEPPARRDPPRRHAGAARRDLLAQRRDRRADRRARLPLGAGDHRHALRGGDRRRHLPGRDDRLQRRVGGRGVDITERNPHSLYISRYPLGRDATVYWPSLDLAFQNDTKNWILVKGFVESDGISVVLYGGERRRVESSDGTMTVTGSIPVRRVKDPTLPKGDTVIEETGSNPSRTSVTRTIYAPSGELIDEETWTTSYKGETRVVRVGTKVEEPKKPPAPPKKPDEGKPPADAPVTPPTQP